MFKESWKRHNWFGVRIYNSIRTLLSSFVPYITPSLGRSVLDAEDGVKVDFFEFGVGLQDGFGGIHGLIAVRRHRFHLPRNFLHTQNPSTSPGTVTFPGKVGYQELLLLHNVLR